MKPHMRARPRAIGHVLACVAGAFGASGAIAAAARAAEATGGQTASAAGQPSGAPPVHESAHGRAVKIKVDADKNVLASSSDHVSGSLSVKLAKQTVIIEAKRDGSWQRVASVRTGRRGHFHADWTPSDVGRYAVRARLPDHSAQGKVNGKVTAYRESNYSWYGPGFYGHRTACGGTLQPGTLGVAHKTLPCGTRIAFRYGGRSITVQVIDRGPYVSGREYDLTAATKDRLGAPSTGSVWNAPLQ